MEETIIITEEFQFPPAFVNSLWVIAVACLAIPLLFYIFHLYKKRISPSAIFAGLGAFIILGYVVNSIALGSVQRGLISALYTAALEVAGVYVIMRILARRRSDKSVPLSYALGYAVIPTLIIHGIGALQKLSVANTFNNMGYTEFLNTVAEADRPILLEMLNGLARETMVQHLMIAAEYALAFALTVGTVRLVWYSIYGERRSANWGFIAAAFVLRAAAEYFHQAEYSIFTECAYYVMAAATLGASVLAAWLWDKPEVYTAKLSRKQL